MVRSDSGEWCEEGWGSGVRRGEESGPSARVENKRITERESSGEYLGEVQEGHVCLRSKDQQKKKKYRLETILHGTVQIEKA